ncbi:MAG: phage holin family protein [Rhodobacteraceae bacterium]|nr:phage holin family protein [Paracoccaceae bacterium]
MNRISRNISIVLRTERMIARRHMAVIRNQTGLYAFAGLVSLIGLVMLNVAAFYALITVMAAQFAALIVALCNLVLAGALVLIAGRLSPGKELEPVTELRDLAIAELEAEAELAVAEAREMSANVRRIARDPLGTALPALLGPLISALLSGRKK